jgi:hypothetical protein
VGAVQSYQWHVLNRSESWLTQAIRTEYAGSYMVERPFQEAIGSMKMIAGTAYMIRADLLRELGWGRSLTEDWELTLRLYTKGYKVVYTPYAETPAECVSTFTRLARQRMRWAEGHTYNVRKWFWSVLRSPRISPTEKIGFAFYATYYLQALFLCLGSLCWLLSEVVFKVHVPEWTSLMGWSLLISNLLSLPLMNLSGLVLEGAPGRDLTGILGALATSYLLVPFQAWAALKGLFERNEGPWFRTPKTGRITDPVWPLRRLGKLRRWLWGPKAGGMQAPGPARISANVTPPRRPARRLGWVMIGGLTLCIGAMAVGALNAPIVEAASSIYLHGSGGGAIALVQKGNGVNGGTTVVVTLPVASTAGNLLTVALGTDNSTTSFSTAASGWTKAVSFGSGLNRSEIWYNANNAGGISSVTFTASAAGSAWGQMSEWSNVATSSPLDQTGTAAGASGTTVTVSTGGATTVANELAITEFTQDSASGVFTPGSGWTNLQQAANAPTEGDDYKLGNAIGTVSETETSNQTGSWSAAIATFKPSAGGQTLDTTIPSGPVQSFDMTVVNNTRTWNTTSSTAAAQTIFSSSTFTFNYWTTGAAGARSSATLTFAYSSSTSCSSPTTIATINTTLNLGSNLNAPSFSPASNVVVPAGSFFCWTMKVNSIASGGVTLSYDGATERTNINSSQTIFIPELVLGVAVLGLIAPLAVRRGVVRQIVSKLGVVSR